MHVLSSSFSANHHCWSQIEQYKQGGAAMFAACDGLLQQIRVGLKTVTVSD
jgi:hypothetical protein